MEKPTHLVLDMTYTEEEGQECYAGTYKECREFVLEEIDYLRYLVVPMEI